MHNIILYIYYRHTHELQLHELRYMSYIRTKSPTHSWPLSSSEERGQGNNRQTEPIHPPPLKERESSGGCAGSVAATLLVPRYQERSNREKSTAAAALHKASNHIPLRLPKCLREE